MRIEMNYLNKNGEMEKVDCLGYAHDSGWCSRYYCECWTEDRGHFIVPANRLHPLENDNSKYNISTYEDGFIVRDNNGDIVFRSSIMFSKPI